MYQFFPLYNLYRSEAEKEKSGKDRPFFLGLTFSHNNFIATFCHVSNTNRITQGPWNPEGQRGNCPPPFIGAEVDVKLVLSKGFVFITPCPPPPGPKDFQTFRHLWLLDVSDCYPPCVILEIAEHTCQQCSAQWVILHYLLSRNEHLNAFENKSVFAQFLAKINEIKDCH